MNKLRISIFCLFAALSPGAGSVFAESRWYVEAGASHISFNQADYGTYLTVPPSLSSPGFVRGVYAEKRRQTAPFIAVGARLTDWLGLRLSYHFMDDITASASGVVIGGDAILISPLQLVDKTKLITLAPELRWKIGSSFALTFSPSANWISSRETVYLLPRRVTFDQRREEHVTFGLSVGALWTFTERTAFALSYGYTDFKPSRGRDARLLSGSLRVLF